ncbi:hypothetical protein BJ322DRAFT_1017589 [Thelephora terrestris]|uniref:Uncharacterized protein n=1 Tax=Thelephora terrestris TaxID=56493 RepID=A0A9P6LAN8_9AGAM|nr:hypothetical protein BJ322DRAFT_1017589 [Thelephora terrestris]
MVSDILEAAGRDPRYLPLLPGLFLFAVPNGNPHTDIADNFDAIYDAEAKYPDNLQHRPFINPSHLPGFATDQFLGPRGITPFLPYVIRGDLVSLLDNDINVIASKLDYPRPPNDAGSSAIGTLASNRSDRSPTPAHDDDDFRPRWDFKTIHGAMAASFRIVVSMLARSGTLVLQVLEFTVQLSIEFS